MRGAFRAHFHDRFGCCPDLPVQEFCSYLANFPRLGEAEGACCEGLITECEVSDALKQVGRKMSPGLLCGEPKSRLLEVQYLLTGDIGREQALLGAVTGNKWCGSFKYRIRDFAIKYGRQLKLDWAKKAKSLEDRLSQAVENLKREASEHYKGFVVRTRLKEFPTEPWNATHSCVRKSSSSPRIGTRTVEWWDAQGLSGTFLWSFCLLFWPPGSGVSQQFSRLPSPLGRKRLAAKVWLLNAKSVTRWSRSGSQVIRIWGYRTCLSFFWRICSTIGLPREPFLVALPGVWSMAGLFGRTYNSAKHRVKDFGPGLSEIGRRYGPR